MKRRGVLKLLVGFGVGSTIMPAQLWMGCFQKTDRDTLDEEHLVLLDEIAETILPADGGLPGAKEAKVANFIAKHIQDCYTKQERQDLIHCIATINKTAVAHYKTPFVELNVKQRFELLDTFDRAAKANVNKTNMAYKNYSKLRALIVFGFFTSELGTKKCLRYAAIPGKYSGQIAYRDGDKMWAFN